MATRACVISDQLAPLEFWNRFRRDAEQRVEECNIIAGEPLWKAVASAEPNLRLTIQSASRSADRIDCAFDPDAAVLTCIPGPDLRGRTRHFRWTGETLRRGGSEFTHAELLALILDELIWLDES